MTYPIDPKLTGARIEAAKARFYDTATTDDERIETGQLMLSLASRQTLEKRIVRWRRIFGIGTIIISVWSSISILLSLAGLKLHPEEGWMKFYVFWGIILASGLTLRIYVNKKLDVLGEEIDRSYPY